MMDTPAVDNSRKQRCANSVALLLMLFLWLLLLLLVLLFVRVMLCCVDQRLRILAAECDDRQISHSHTASVVAVACCLQC